MHMLVPEHNVLPHRTVHGFKTPWYFAFVPVCSCIRCGVFACDASREGYRPRDFGDAEIETGGVGARVGGEDPSKVLGGSRFMPFVDRKDTFFPSLGHWARALSELRR